MKVPDKISIDQVFVGERGRSTYDGIDELAENIRLNGLIQPIVLNPDFSLAAGGRRLRALHQLGVQELHHAATSDPNRYGFVIKGDDEKTPLNSLYTEIAENLVRHEMDWRDQLKLIVKAYRLANAQANALGKEILRQDFSVLVGVDYQDLKAAIAIYDDVMANPTRYANVTSIRGAYAELLKYNAQIAQQMAALKSLGASPPQRIRVTNNKEPAPVDGEEAINIPLNKNFRHTNGVVFMEKSKPDTFDHIVTDPDYGISLDTLGSNSDSLAAGVEHKSIQESLDDLERFIVASHRCLKASGFCVFFYDLDYHERLQQIATKIGFRAQRWPLIWHKTDYYSNAGPTYNFTKNLEYAMVLRKPNATLTRPQSTSVFQCGSLETTKKYGHPFAKPLSLWYWIYDAIAIKGQLVLDPFAGSGTACVAAARRGLRTMGCEINEDWYHTLIFNLQSEYKELLGSNVIFT